LGTKKRAKNLKKGGMHAVLETEDERRISGKKKKEFLYL